MVSGVGVFRDGGGWRAPGWCVLKRAQWFLEGGGLSGGEGLWGGLEAWTAVEGR